MLNTTYAKHTGKSVEEIAKAMERDYFMSAEEAVDFGIIDKIIPNRESMMIKKDGTLLK